MWYARNMAPDDPPSDPVENEIRALDPALAAFAREHGLDAVRNDRGRPGRSLRWTSGGIERAIDVGLADETPPTWDVWAVAWRTDPRRLGKTALVRESARAESLAGEAPVVLEEARVQANAWTLRDLEPWDEPEAPLEPELEEPSRMRLLGWILFLVAGALVVWGSDWILETLLGL